MAGNRFPRLPRHAIAHNNGLPRRTRRIAEVEFVVDLVNALPVDPGKRLKRRAARSYQLRRGGRRLSSRPRVSLSRPKQASGDKGSSNVVGVANTAPSVPHNPGMKRLIEARKTGDASPCHGRNPSIKFFVPSKLLSRADFPFKTGRDPIFSPQRQRRRHPRSSCIY